MEGTSYSYRMLNDLSYYADVKFIETNCYIKGDKTIKLVKSNDSDLYTTYRQYSFKINPCYGFTSCVLDSIKIFGNELSANDYTYDEKTGYYTITSRVID